VTLEQLLQKVKLLAPDIVNPVRVKGILLITTFRSGSSFLGDLLQQSDTLTYYHFEPLRSLLSNTRLDS
jgi:hypothetical protein